MKGHYLLKQQLKLLKRGQHERCCTQRVSVKQPQRTNVFGGTLILSISTITTVSIIVISVFGESSATIMPLSSSLSSSRQPMIELASNHEHQNRLVLKRAESNSADEDKKAGEKLGQLEIFSSEATGLGDMEASDALKKMNKRSFGAGLATKGEESHHLLLPKRMRRNLLLARQRRSKIIQEIAGRVRRTVEARQQLLGGDGNGGASNLRNNDVISDGGQPETGQNPLGALRKSSLLSPQQQQQQQQWQQQLIGHPILIERRTEELLDEPPVTTNDSSSNDLEQQQVTSQKEEADQFPLMGEFGSRLSLLTSRKVEPGFLSGGSRNLFNLINNPNQQQERFEADNEDWLGNQLEPVSSRIFITSRPNNFLMAAPHHQLQVTTDGGDGTNLSKEDDTSEQDGVLIMDLGSNYLPRIARGIM